MKKVKKPEDVPILRINMVLDEEIFTAVFGTSILSGMSRIGLGPIAEIIERLKLNKKKKKKSENNFSPLPIIGTVMITSSSVQNFA